MESIKQLKSNWQDASINLKFIVGITIITGLISILAITTFLSSYLITTQTEEQIFLAADIQRLTLDTDRQFQQALVLQRDFFSRYDDEGLAQAQTKYALPAIERLEEVLSLVDKLEIKLESLTVKIDSETLETYRRVANQNKTTFIEAASFIFILTAPETGLEGQLDRTAEDLAEFFKDHPLLVTEFNDLRLLEREYFILRKPSSMDFVYAKIEQIKTEANNSDILETSIRNEILTLLDIHLAIAEEIVAVDAKIQELSFNFDASTKPLTQSSAALIGFADQESAKAHEGLSRISQTLTLATILISTAVLGVSLLTFRTLRKHITPRIIDLTKTAMQYQEGNFNIRNTIKNNDEIGKLGKAFNLMASEISRLLADLEAQNQIVNNINSELSTELVIKEKIQQSLESNQSRLKQYAADLERSNEELEEFAYIVSHDLRAPLRGIASLSSWLELDYSENLDENGIEMLALLNNRVKRLETLIEGILKFSRVGREETRKGVVSISEIIDEVIDTLAPPANIRFDIQGDLPEVECEPIRCLQVFQNLIDNAIKYNDKPEGVIEIRCKDQDDAWCFSIKDNGCGIDEKYNKKIFQIFQTLSMDEDELAQSSGVGLSLVRKIILLHKGDIWVESKVGEWSKFSFTLPKSVDIDPKITIEHEEEQKSLEAIST